MSSKLSMPPNLPVYQFLLSQWLKNIVQVIFTPNWRQSRSHRTWFSFLPTADRGSGRKGGWYTSIIMAAASWHNVLLSLSLLLTLTLSLFFLLLYLFVTQRHTLSHACHNVTLLLNTAPCIRFRFPEPSPGKPAASIWMHTFMKASGSRCIDSTAFV